MRRFTLPLSTLVAVFIFTMLIFAVRVPAAHAQDYIPLAPIAGPGINAADQFTRCDPMPKYGAAGELTNEAELCLPKYLRTLYNMGVALAGLFLVFSIVRGGFTLMFTDSVLNRLEGKKIILQAMGGAVIVFSSYLFMNLINPQLAERLNLSLKFPSITIQKFASKLEAVPVKTTPEMAQILASARNIKYEDAQKTANQWFREAELAEMAGDTETAQGLRSSALDLLTTTGSRDSKVAIENAVEYPPAEGRFFDRLNKASNNAQVLITEMDRMYRQNLAEMETIGDVDGLVKHYVQKNADKNSGYKQIADMFIKNAEAYDGSSLLPGTQFASKQAESMMNAIRAGAEDVVRNLTELRNAAPDSNVKTRFTNAIDAVKEEANGQINNIKAHCTTREGGTARNAQSSPLPCKNATISI